MNKPIDIIILYNISDLNYGGKHTIVFLMTMITTVINGVYLVLYQIMWKEMKYCIGMDSIYNCTYYHNIHIDVKKHFI